VHQRPTDDGYRPPEQRADEESPRRPPAEGVDSLAPTYGTPDPYRPAGYGADDPLTSSGGFLQNPEPPPRPALDAIRVPLRAGEYPPVRPSGSVVGEEPPAPVRVDPPAAPTSPGYGPARPAYNEPTSFVPPVGVRTADGPAPADHAGPGRSGANGVYRTRRPVSAAVSGVVTALLLIPAVRLLIDGATAHQPTARGIVPAVLLTLGLPLTGIGLYAVASAGRTLDRSAWTRPPVGYLVVGLVLLVAAALATS
jgi:hypothetical protein